MSVKIYKLILFFYRMLEKEKPKIDFKYNLREYFSFVFNYKFLLFFLVLSSVIYQFLELSESYFFKKIVDNAGFYLDGSLSSNSFVSFLIYLAIAFLVIVFLRFILKWLGLFFLNRLQVNLITDFKRKYFNHIVSLSHRFHTTNKTGSLISRLNRGSRAMEMLTDVLFFQVSPLIFQVIIVGFSLSYFNKTAGIVSGLMVVVFVSYSLFIQNTQKKYKAIANKFDDSEKGFIGDTFTNIDSVKYFGKENKIKNLFFKKTKDTKDACIKDWNFFCWQDAGQNAIVGLGTFFILFFSLKAFIAKELTLGELTFIFSVFGNLIGPMYSFVWGIRTISRAMVDFQDIFEYGKIENEIKDLPNAKPLKISRGKISFKNISFDYENKELFKNFNLEVSPSEKVAFVGHSGCGKTTLVKLLYRFYDLKEGDIYIDDTNIKNVPQESLRSEMSIVPQEAILFDDTIYNNILFARPSASRKEVLRAMKMAKLDEVVKDFPNKEKTIVGERGVKLSGGEKQRVSIARAILADKKILVLDEATSALDSETEEDIQKSLKHLLKNRTSIIIAHRLSTIMSADRIVVLKNGKIVEEGKHKDLISKKGEYYKLWKIQKGGYM